MRAIHYIECECGSVNHVARICWMPEDDIDCCDTWIEFQLVRLGFFRRLLNAFKYVFNIQHPFGQWDITFIRQEDKKAIVSMLQDSIKHHEQSKSK